jgi:hypothetical protein
VKMGLELLELELGWSTGYPEGSRPGVGASPDRDIIEDEASNVTYCVLVM